MWLIVKNYQPPNYQNNKTCLDLSTDSMLPFKKKVELKGGHNSTKCLAELLVPDSSQGFQIKQMCDAFLF
jgi:hypothetical protein